MARHRSSRGGSGIVRSGRLLTAAALLSVLAILAALWAPPVPMSEGRADQWAGLMRLATASVVASTLILGPGLVLSRPSRPGRLPLGFVPLPGILLMSAIGALAWVAADLVDPAVTCTAAAIAALVVVAALAWTRDVLQPREGRVLALTGFVYLAALGRGVWSLGPAGEMHGGAVSRTLEVGDRPDARISYHITSLVAHGLDPYSEAGAVLFAPYTFSDRGPIPGLMSAPVMLALGTTPTYGAPDGPWSLFDVEGFAVYRVVMMMLALVAVLAVYSVARALGGPNVGWLAALVTAGSPFIVHEVYFTWPKLAAGWACLLAGYLVWRRRLVGAGLMTSLGFLMHPLALLTLPTLFIVLVLTRPRAGPGARPIRRLVRQGAQVLLPVAATMACWAVINAGHYTQGGFVNYARSANGVLPATLSAWVDSRLTSLASTLVPLWLPLHEGSNPSINAIYGEQSHPLVHFFFQYWNGVPFGFGIFFFAAFVVGLVHMMRARPWLTTGIVVIPFLFFAVYWGSSVSGLLREGLHPWALSALLVWALHLQVRMDRGDGVPGWVRACLALRVGEIALMMTVPTIHAHRTLVGSGHEDADMVAVGLMVVGVAGVAVSTILGTRRTGFLVAPPTTAEGAAEARLGSELVRAGSRC